MSDDVAPLSTDLTKPRREFRHTQLQTFKEATDVVINRLGIIPERAMTAILVTSQLTNPWLQRREDFIRQTGRRDRILAAGKDKHGAANGSKLGPKIHCAHLTTRQ
jgi:hypothetical protein